MYIHRLRILFRKLDDDTNSPFRYISRGIDYQRYHQCLGIL